MSAPDRNPQAQVDDLLRRLSADLAPADAAGVVALVAWRAAVELQRVSNVEMKKRQGQPDWGGWARLRNAARKLVLEASTARDEVRELAASDG